MSQVLTRRTAISTSKIEYVELNLNPIRGCSHACRYCYARLIDLRYKKVKNAAEWHKPIAYEGFLEQLERELKKGKYSKTQEIFISTMTDLYQPYAVKLGLGRKIILLIKKYDYTFRLLTKSPAIVNDKDILAYPKGLVGLSITTNPENDEARKYWEPRTKSIQDRLDALKELSEVQDIQLWVSAEPFLPGTDFDLYYQAIFKHTMNNNALKELVVGKMNYTAGVDDKFDWESVVRITEEYAKKYPMVRIHYKKEFVKHLVKKKLTPVKLGLISEEEFQKRQEIRSWITETKKKNIKQTALLK